MSFLSFHDAKAWWAQRNCFTRQDTDDRFSNLSSRPTLVPKILELGGKLTSCCFFPQSSSVYTWRSSPGLFHQKNSQFATFLGSSSISLLNSTHTHTPRCEHFVITPRLQFKHRKTAREVECDGAVKPPLSTTDGTKRESEWFHTRWRNAGSLSF